jgi:predicted DNA-binding transcriptional regulator AlpA
VLTRSGGEVATKRERAEKLLLSAAEAARQVYGVSERTFHEMRRRGLVPPAIELSPRILRFHRAELEEWATRLPRQQRPASAGMPPQLLRGQQAKRAITGGTT